MELVIRTQPSGPLCLWQCFLYRVIERDCSLDIMSYYHLYNKTSLCENLSFQGRGVQLQSLPLDSSRKALDIPPFSVKRANVEKSAPNHPGKPLHPPPLQAMTQNDNVGQIFVLSGPFGIACVSKLFEPRGLPLR